MGDREYWQDYRNRLTSRLGLMRAGLDNKFEGSADASSPDANLTHQDIRDMQQVREQEIHLAAVERLLAGNGQLE